MHSFVKYFVISVLCFAFRVVFGQVLLNYGSGTYDVDGNFYSSIVLSNGQEWTTSNLKTTHFSDGTAIAFCPESSVWSNTVSPSYSNYNNSMDQADTYGLLYNFFVANNSRNVCPSGWRVPTQLDWTNLTQALGGLGVSGGKLKAEGLTHWAQPNFLATDEIHFKALPNGCRYEGGNYNNLTFYSFFWTSTELDTVFGWYRALKYNTDATIRDYTKKQSGYAIRCMRDSELVGLVNADKNQMFITPNPASSYVQVVSNMPFSPDEIIKVYDFNGRMLLCKPIDSGEINITSLTPGIYFLELEYGEHKSRMKLIKE